MESPSHQRSDTRTAPSLKLILSDRDSVHSQDQTLGKPLGPEAWPSCPS